MKISGHFGAFRGFRRPFVLQFQCDADDSLLRTEQAISSPQAGNFSPKQGNSYGDRGTGVGRNKRSALRRGLADYASLIRPTGLLLWHRSGEQTASSFSSSNNEISNLHNCIIGLFSDPSTARISVPDPGRAAAHAARSCSASPEGNSASAFASSAPVFSAPLNPPRPLRHCRAPLPRAQAARCLAAVPAQ